METKTKATANDSTQPKKRYIPPRYMVKKTFTVDLNVADTFDLQEIHGIGPTFAKRIVKYRETLGGFINIEQLHEVWGIDSSLFERIRKHVYIKGTHLQKININAANLTTLKKHPYLDYYQAKEIFMYRQKHGLFESVNAIMKLSLMDSGTFSRVAPYLYVKDSVPD